jgi:sulfur transfer complex TusBCD TusB component (DsrH family)
LTRLLGACIRAPEYGLQTGLDFCFIKPLSRELPARPPRIPVITATRKVRSGGQGWPLQGGLAKQAREGVTLVAIYLSMHIIACMTRQALNQLIATLQAAPEVRFIRASASQMAGRLLCEFDAPDQDTLLQLLDKHHVTYEWIIRAELSWGEPPTAPAPALEASASSTPPASPRAQQGVPGNRTSGAPEATPEPLAVEQPDTLPVMLSDPSEATILHILRSLRDESAWQIIRAQHDTQPVAVLLMHDAVLAPPPLDVLMYACEADVMARGITSPLPRLSYEQIVDLIFTCGRVMVW